MAAPAPNPGLRSSLVAGLAFAGSALALNPCRKGRLRTGFFLKENASPQVQEILRRCCELSNLETSKFLAQLDIFDLQSPRNEKFKRFFKEHLSTRFKPESLPDTDQKIRELMEILIREVKDPRAKQVLISSLNSFRS